MFLLVTVIFFSEVGGGRHGDQQIAQLKVIYFFDSGRSSSKATLSRLAEDGFNQAAMFPPNHGHAVTVPGAAAAWIDTVQHFGSGKVVTSVHNIVMWRIVAERIL